MAKKKKKNNLRLRHLILILFSIYVVITFVSQQKTIRALKTEKIMKEEEIVKLKKEVKELDKEIKDSDSLEFVEKVAREELNMVKPKEIIYVDQNKNKNLFFKTRKP
ncbi:MAG TPA: septum formation initiator family protein [Tissierellales bacterium]|nr:septum formation initiator family protein [Tissierellales bacterium]